MTRKSRPSRRQAWLLALLLLAAGATGGLAMQPFAELPFIALTMMAALMALDFIHRDTGSLRRKLWRAFACGWLIGFGYLVAGLWWLGKAFLVEADQFAWAMPFGVVGLPAVLAIYTGLGMAAALLLWSRSWTRLFALAFGLGLAEWLRGTLLTGFPWNVYGMALGNHLWPMQTGAFIGLYGLTLLTILIFATPAMAILPASWHAALEIRRDWRPLIIAAAALALIAAYGWWRVPAEQQPTQVGVRLRVVQPNVPQDENFVAANGEAILENYIALSRNNLPAPPPTHYIWPESAFPFLLHRNIEALDRIGAMLQPGNATLITGAARMGPPLPGEEVGTFFNAIQAIDADGIIRDTYDKVHLVPFGEYEPAFAKSLLRLTGLRQFVSIPGGFTPGAARKPFFVRGLPPIAASICYEAIFPGEILPQTTMNQADARQGVIINVTNDAWFGDSPGPYQHFAQARLRAVEQGLPLVRAANSGVSGVIDPYGRVLHRTALNEVAVFDAELPLPLDEPTLFSRWREWPFAAMLACCLALALCGRLRKTP